jgi:hypothetical protein
MLNKSKEEKKDTVTARVAKKPVCFSVLFLHLRALPYLCGQLNRVFKLGLKLI